MYGFYTFTLKLAASLAILIMGLALGWSGYVANVAQSESTLFWMRLLATIFQFAMATLGAILLFFYPIKGDMHSRIIQELAARKK